jgi:hypothetical protein
MKIVIAIAVALIAFLVVFDLYKNENEFHKPYHMTVADTSFTRKMTFQVNVNEGLSLLRHYKPAAERISKADILRELDDISLLASLLRSAPGVLEGYTRDSLQKLRQELQALQVRDLPVLRQNFTKDLSNKLYLANSEAKCSGPGNTEITFLGGTFAFQTNIKQAQELLGNVMKRLRFKKVNFSWWQHEAHTVSYPLSEDSDSVLVPNH